jgi:YesN/AraC family two-component response regulator
VFSWVHFFTEGDFSYSEKLVSNSSTKMNKNKFYRTEQFTLSLPQLGVIGGKQKETMRNYLSQISRVKIDRQNRQKLFFESISSQIVYQILFMRILSLICQTDDKPVEKDLAEEVYSHLANNHASPFSLAELAGQFAFHSTYITRCVKKKYEMTPLQLLISIRMEKAKNMLKTTDLHINTIGRLAGYDDAAYFSKQFRKSVGMTAAQYRRTARVEPEGE